MMICFMIRDRIFLFMESVSLPTVVRVQIYL